MKKTFKNLKITTAIYSILYLILGIMLIAFPTTAKLTIFYILGLCLVVYGIVDIVNYFIYGFEFFGFWTGCFNILIGIVVLSSARFLATTSVFAFVFGVVFLINALIKLQKSFDYRRAGSKTWWIDAVWSVVILILGIVILANPFVSDRFLTIFIGICAVIDALSQIISLIVVTSKLKKKKHKFSDLVKPEIIDIDEDDYTIEK